MFPNQFVPLQSVCHYGILQWTWVNPITLIFRVWNWEVIYILLFSYINFFGLVVFYRKIFKKKLNQTKTEICGFNRCRLWIVVKPFLGRAHVSTKLMWTFNSYSTWPKANEYNIRNNYIGVQSCPVIPYHFGFCFTRQLHELQWSVPIKVLYIFFGGKIMVFKF